MMFICLENAIGRFASLCGLFFLSVSFPNTSFAQIVAEINGPNGKLIAGVEFGKTSDIGRFDDYVGPIIAREIRSFLHLTGQRKGTHESYADINRVADYMNQTERKIRLKYTGSLGINFLVGYEFNDFLRNNHGGFRVSVFNYLDRNSIKVFAPQGIGILTDPTALKADVQVRNFGFILEAPLLFYKSKSHTHTSYFGLGFVQNKTISRGIAQSDFLDISIAEKRVLNRPVISYAYRLRPMHEDRDSPYGLDLQVQMFHTNKMYNATLRASIVRSIYE